MEEEPKHYDLDFARYLGIVLMGLWHVEDIARRVVSDHASELESLKSYLAARDKSLSKLRHDVPGPAKWRAALFDPPVYWRNAICHSVPILGGVALVHTPDSEEKLEWFRCRMSGCRVMKFRPDGRERVSIHQDSLAAMLVHVAAIDRIFELPGHPEDDVALLGQDQVGLSPLVGAVDAPRLAGVVRPEPYAPVAPVDEVSAADAAAAEGAAQQLVRLREECERVTVTIARRELREWLRASTEGRVVEDAVGKLLAGG